LYLQGSNVLPSTPSIISDFQLISRKLLMLISDIGESVFRTKTWFLSASMNRQAALKGSRSALGISIKESTDFLKKTRFS
jgi:hypothetical protein